MATDTMEATPTPTPAAVKTRHDIFKFQAWVHLGDDVDECPLTQATQAEDYVVGAQVPLCADPYHFHAWLRIPNQFQLTDIGEKAQAALARRKRLLRDPQSDAYAILELELEEITNEESRALLVDEIVDRDFEQHYVEAVREVEAELSDEPAEDGETPKRFETIIQDREEFERLKALPEEERDAQEFEALGRHLQSYDEAVRAATVRRQDEMRATLAERELSDLIDVVRRERIEAEGQSAYIQTFNLWQWWTCTYKPRREGIPNERVWKDIHQMRMEASSDIIDTLRTRFGELERELAKSRMAKNS